MQYTDWGERAANSASNWLDVLAELRAHAHAIAVDLPGTIAGHTALANRRAASIETNVLFLHDFTDALGLDRVVVHGWSAGGMIALPFADQAPERVAGLELVVPALPPPTARRACGKPSAEQGWPSSHRLPLCYCPFRAGASSLGTCGNWTIPR